MHRRQMARSSWSRRFWKTSSPPHVGRSDSARFSQEFRAFCCAGDRESVAASDEPDERKSVFERGRIGRARLLPSLVRPQFGDRRRLPLKPPADAELKLVFGSAGASPSHFKHILSRMVVCELLQSQMHRCPMVSGETESAQRIRLWSFGFCHSFDIRISTFVISGTV